MLNIVFRADASTVIGSGHIMRSLTLAHQLASDGAKVTFLTRQHTGNLIDLISSFGYQVFSLSSPKSVIKQHNTNSWLGYSQQEDANECISKIQKIAQVDYLIIDHYAIDKNWHQQLRPYCRKLMVIDDLANRKYDCDILLDQTLNRQRQDYLTYVPEQCQLLLGKDFMLLRNEFSLARAEAEQKHKTDNEKTPANILVSMGSGDPDNLTLLTIQALIKLKRNISELSATIIISSKAKFVNDIKTEIGLHSWLFLVIDCQNIARLMLNASIAIGASGSTAWERCCLGLPCITLVSAENQLTIAENLATEQAIINLGWHKNITPDMLANAINDLLKDKNKYNFMVQQCLSCCDGLGVEKVVNEVFTNV